MFCIIFLPEVVYIGTVHSNHAELSIKMLTAGKHVLCEKSMGINYKQVKQVLDVAKEKNLLFVEVRNLGLMERACINMSGGVIEWLTRRTSNLRIASRMGSNPVMDKPLFP